MMKGAMTRTPRILTGGLALILLLSSGAALAQKVALNPSNQTANLLCNGGNEATYAVINANKTEAILDASGYNARVDGDFYNAPGNANSWGASIFVSFHSNAGGGHGTETLYKVNEDKIIAGDVQNGLLSKLPYQSRGLKVRTDLHVLNATSMPACLTEVVFHDCCTSSGYQGHPPSEADFLKSTSGQDKIAAGISKGICAYYDDTTCSGGTTPQKGWYKGVVYKAPDTADRIAGATVKLNTGQTKTTDSVGYFEFELTAGTYTATASKAGYTSGSSTEAVVAGEDIWGSIGLSVACSCDDGNPCTNDTCDASGACAHTNNSASCDDGSACTSGDKCSGGSCQGTAISCDDGEPCTDDGCSGSSGCTHTHHTRACDDGDACTAGDQCGGGSCHGSAISCDDGNPCTDDGCDHASGCTATPNADACDDGDACTAGDQCAGGACGGAAVDCDDDDLCTDDGCDALMGCWHELNVAPCDDGDLCTVDDACLDGACVGSPDACDDGEPCTLDGCDVDVGCLHVVLEGACDDGDPCTAWDACVEGVCGGQSVTGLACDDGDACTTGDTCVEGACVGEDTSAVDCDDAEACTLDLCQATLGCLHTPRGGACDDGEVCTSGDACQDGACVGQDVDHAACDDDDPCTADTCDAAQGCLYAPAEGSCDDLQACTVNDHCEEGACVGAPLTGPACDDGLVCTTGDACAAGACAGTPDASICDDGEPCTSDACDPAVGCLNVAIMGACDDGDACTKGDACEDGVCVGQALDPATDCGDVNACTEALCHPDLGCLYLHLTGPCDDGDACTSGDACQQGQCAPAALTTCDDATACTSDACDPVTGACVFTPDHAPCLDANPCTEDLCASGLGCVHAYLEGPCDDGDACTQDDACVAGQCRPGKLLVCMDGDPCTDDGCDPLSGACVFSPNTASCDDGDPCTVTACAEGACQVVMTLPGCCDTDEDCERPAQWCDPVDGVCQEVLCAPCEVDGDCGPADSRCLALDGEAWGCGVACGDELPCPHGYTCAAIAGAPAQCVPVSGRCHCEHHATLACDDGALTWFTSCGAQEDVVDDCGGRGCVGTGCCPPGTHQEGASCVADAVAPPPDAVAPPDVIDQDADTDDASGVDDAKDPRDFTGEDERRPRPEVREVREHRGDGRGDDTAQPTASAGGGCAASGRSGGMAPLVVSLWGALVWITLRRRRRPQQG